MLKKCLKNQKNSKAKPISKKKVTSEEDQAAILEETPITDKELDTMEADPSVTKKDLRAKMYNKVSEMAMELEIAKAEASDWERKFKNEEAISTGLRAKLQAIKDISEEFKETEAWWLAKLEKFLKQNSELGSYKGKSIKVQRAYIKPWAIFIGKAKAGPSAALLARYFKEAKPDLMTSSKNRIVKTLIHFTSVAIPGLNLTYRAPYQEMKPKEKVEVTPGVLNKVRELLVGKLYGAKFAERVKERADSGDFLLRDGDKAIAIRPNKSSPEKADA